MVTYRYSLKGGYLTAIEHDGKNIMYTPDPRSWNGTDVAIFPFVARLKEGQYTVDGKTYSMKNHGLVRYYPITVIKDDGKNAILQFESNEETKKEYPFDFSFKINYTSTENGLFVAYEVTNTGNVDMPFGIGSHPSFKLPCIEKETETDISGNYLEFEEEVELIAVDFNKECTFPRGTTTEMGFVKKLDLSKVFFRKFPTLVLDASKIKKVTLCKKDGSKVIMNFNSRYIAFWSHPQYGDYVCMEPWMSLPDFVDAP
ncbi:MAG: hypothetical protein MJ239_07780, partial [Bacilli bacterium]|nr:hypothetical protein [Bacilli bacterium]